MRSFSVLAALVGAAAAVPFSLNPRAGLTASGFTKATPGTADDIVLTQDNTVNGTAYNDDKTVVITPKDLGARALGANLAFKFVNSFSGGAVKAYVNGLDSDNHPVFIGANGQLIYPSSGGSGVPVRITQNIAIPLGAKGTTTNFNLPIQIHSGRVWFSEGDLPFFVVSTGNGEGIVQPSVTNLQDPSAGINFGFVELTYTNGVIYANISYVDFVGMILGMKLQNTDGGSQTTPGLNSPDAVSKICNDLVAQKNADGFGWNNLCIANSAGVPIRALAPIDYHDINSNTFANYWPSYVDQVWAKYSSTPLTINTQTGSGNVNCRVSNNVMNCDGDNRGYAKPVAKDIWGCNAGPFLFQGGDNAVHYAVVPRICAAFNRATLLLNGGNVQPSLGQSSYYTTNPNNHYSRIVHKYEVNNKGYAFSYDDVNPDGNENASGVVSSGNPQTLTVYVGAPPS
ncbi:Fc.00g104070.m01.CDS01 [Cosmosporella sp. VM-42]